MSTVTKAISSVEFHVNARQANAALQSMQEEAKKCSEEIDRLQKEAAKGVKMTVVDGQQIDIEKRISQVKSLQKTWKEAIQSQIKGAKAFDELWKNARMGTIESMNGAQIKAGINASKPIYDRLRLGDAEDRMKAQAIKDMQDQGQKVLNQLKTTTDQIIKQIADGETIAADVLEREARNLKSIMDLLPPLSQEWKDYNLQYQAINQQIERQTVLERQLRGEIVTREDAIRVINAANREATQQEIAQEEQRAKAAREAAEAKASEADQYRTTVEQKQSEIFATNDLIAAKRREIDAHHESAAAAKDAADKAREAAYKDRKQAEQEAREQQDAYNKQKKIRDDAAKDVEKFRKELEKLGEVKAEPKVDTSEIERLKKKIESTIDELGTLEQQWDDKIADYIFEKYPTQATVSAKTKSPEGLKEREAMKKDTVLAQMQKQREQELNAVDERLTSLIRKEREWTEAQQQSTTAQQQSTTATAASNEQDEKRAGVQQKLTDAETRLADENRKLNEQADKTITANQQATQAVNTHQQSVKALGDVMEENRKTGQRLGEEMGQLTKQHKQQTEELAEASEKMTDAEKESNRHIKTEQEARLRIQQLNNQSIEQLTASLRVLEEENRRINDPGNQRWQENERYIGQLNLRLEELKKQSADLRREPVLDMMTQRMDQLGTLSRDALTETKKFWQAMYDGADNDANKLREIEDNLKRINTEEQERDRKTLKERAARLQNVDNYSVGELREGIEAAKRLQDQYHLTDDEIQKLSVSIVAAETRIAKVGVEAERQAQRQREQIELMEQQLANGSALTESALKAQENYWQRLADDPKAAAEAVKQYTANLEEVHRLQKENSDKTIRERAARLDNVDSYSVGEIQEGIDAAKKMQQTFHLSEEELTNLSKKIVDAETRIAKVGVEAERQAQKQREQIDLMQQQLANGSALTESALKAQVNYWQRLADDPKAAAEAVKQYTANMERAQSLLDVKERVDIRMKAGRLDNMDGYSVSELREGIDAAKKMQDTFRLSNDEVQQLSEKIVAAEVRISQFSVESERQAQRQREQIALMEQQLANGSALTESALKAQVNYWQRLADDPKAAAEAVAQYTANMKQAQDLLDQSQRADIESKAGRLQNLGAYSVAEIREGIEAAKKMQQTFHLTDGEVQQLSEDIVAAEKHVSQFSVETERAAQKQREQIDLMEEQLRRGTGLTETALKQQESYWRRLADDPKAAASEIARYFENLNKVHAIQKEQAESQTTAYGLNALNFFRGDTSNASADQIKEQAKALKAYRDSLPRKDNADLLIEIDSYLAKSGQVAKEATGELMNLGEALEMAGKAGKDGFSATEDEIKKAIASIEKAIEIDRELVKQHRRAGNTQMAEYNEEEIKEYEKALKGLNLELKNVGISHERMQKILENPISADNLDELRDAIKRAKAELNSMDGALGENSDQYKQMAEQVRNAKNVMKEMEGQAKASATAWEKAFSRLKTYVVMYMGFNEVWQKVSNTARDLMDLSDKMGEVRKTTQMTADEVGRLSENLKKMDVRTNLVSLLEISSSAGQLGLKTLEDVQGFTEAANKLMIALPEMGREAATEMMRVAIATGEVDKIRKQLQEGTIEGSSATAVAMEKIASTIDRLRATSASTAPEITDFVKRVGAVGAQSGITIDQVAALGSTVSSLGMRIEMSATALSRMIPAIRNNAFELAKAIGVTPDTIRNLFDTGRGMEVILMILQRIKDTGMDADSVEQMLGMAGMRDIMKDLNQQGARAGIVFSGLSQNVDELRRQLGVASEAYEENIAIQQEFDKMNETTAAKWERLKNAFEEMFVGDEAQRGLGVLIDMLRGAVDIINDLQGYIVRIGIAFAAWKAGVGGAIWTYLINPIRLALTGVHSLDFQVKGLAATWRTAWKSMDAATKTNWIFAIISAVIMLGKHIYDTATRISELQQELNRLDNETDDAVRHVGRLVTSFNEVSVKANAANKKEAELREQTEKLSKEVDKLKKSTDDGTASTDELKKKQAELEEKEKQLKKATDESNKANKERSNLISEMNSKYSTYLGYMLNEKTAAEQVASAHQLIIAALKEERKQKGLNALHDAVDKEYAEDIKEYSEDSQSNLKDIPRGAQRRILDQWRRVLTAATIDADKGEFRLSGVNGVTKGGTYRSEEELKKAMRSALREIIKTEAADVSGNVNVSTWAGKGIKSVDTFLNDIWGNSIDDGFGDWAETYISRERDIAQATHDNQVEVNQAHQETVQAAVADINSNMEALRKTSAKNNKFTDDQIRSMAQNVNALVAGYERHSEDMADSERNRIFGEGNEATLQNAVNNVLANLDQNTRARVFRVAQRGKKAGTGDVDTNITNPWGTSERADSTTYTEMTAEQLVNRREQMNKFVNSIQTDTDVKAVLNEDKALKKAIEAGMSSDMRTVIEWYNTERLKIQDELHARHLTNTGDWLDPKKERMRKKQLQDEWNMYLREIDAYYTERKTRIEEAGTDEGLTEAEIRNRTLANEMEWRQRRAELQKIYADKSVEVTAEEQQAIFDIISERTGDDVKYVKAQIASTVKFMKDIGKMSEKELKEALSKLGLGWERDFLKQQQAVTQQMKAIQDIIDKERPFNGITKQLRESLATMDILTGDMRERYKELLKMGTDEEKKRFNEEQNREELRRTSFLLGEAEQAYSTTIDRVMQQMREKGMTAWADWLSIHPEQQEALMAQLRQTYDAIQDAIKKEASQLKKQAEIMWNNILVPGGDGKTTMKQMLDRTVAQLGIDQGRVSRANNLIGAGVASDRVADKLAIQQMQLQLTMQEHYYNLMKKQGRAHVDMLNQQADAAERRGNAEEATRKRLDAQHAEMALNLATAKEETELAKQREEIIARTEESQNRLYTELRSWADLLTSSLQGVMEASHAGDAEYYNERAKLNLTGKGGPGAGTYVVIDDAGTSDAKAHYEYLDERQALERQHEIERENAQAEAWKKLWDDINMKMSEQITDWMNAYLQNKATEDNTAELQRLQQKLEAEQQKMDASVTATDANTQAVQGLTQQLAEGITIKQDGTQPDATGGSDFAADKQAGYPSGGGELSPAAQQQINEQNAVTENFISNKQKEVTTETQTGKKIASTNASTFAKMTQAVNLYGIAYQAMSNDNLSTEQKFQMMAVQAAGNAAISMLTTEMASASAKAATDTPGVLGTLWKQLGWAAAPVFAIFTGLLGGLMGLATSKIGKAKSEIAQATGTSVGAGRLATGMLTYAEGNVNELTDPTSLTPGRQYNVDGADGKTYRARYMGKGAKTHITNGPEFHLVGEAGREAIIDAKTTRLLQMNETGIWRDIQTLYNGGSISGLSTRRRRGGVRAFADGNVGEFEDAMGGDNIAANGTGGMGMEQMLSFQQSIDANTAIMQRLADEGIEAFVSPYGKRGIVNGYDHYKKEAQRQGVKY